MQNEIIKRALVCTDKETAYLEVYTLKAPYVVSLITSSRITLEEIKDVPGIEPLLYHLKTSSGLSLKGRKLKDFADPETLREVNIRANDVPELPCKILLVWD